MKKDQKPSSSLRDLLGIKEPSDRGGKKPILKRTHFTIWYFVIAFLIILLIQNYMMTKKKPRMSSRIVNLRKPYGRVKLRN